MHGNIPYMFEGCSSPSITKGLQNTVLRLTESNQTHGKVKPMHLNQEVAGGWEGYLVPMNLSTSPVQHLTSTIEEELCGKM